MKNILINALGVQDSGGIRILNKVIEECEQDIESRFLILCNENENINILIKKYNSIENIEFKKNLVKGFLYRLYYENVKLKELIISENIDLIYNFSGTSQPFLKIPQLLKIQNLLFYTKKINEVYKKNNKFVLWLKQIYFKRVIFNFMSNRSPFLEVQSPHVKEYMSDFITTDNKTFFLKSDIDVEANQFLEPKKYDFTQKVKFLYIVGPHFEYIHKNFIDFTNAMLELDKMNIDYEINVTLTREQLDFSSLWDNSLNNKTNFLGYISDDKEMDKLFCDNTILISTSIIETLGLHVVEAIKKGIVPIAPSEMYSYSVYGNNIITYELFNTKSLLNAILSIITHEIDCEKNILTLQNDLKKSENSKYKSIVDIFHKVLEKAHI